MSEFNSALSPLEVIDVDGVDEGQLTVNPDEKEKEVCMKREKGIY